MKKPETKKPPLVLACSICYKEYVPATSDFPWIEWLYKITGTNIKGICPSCIIKSGRWPIGFNGTPGLLEANEGTRTLGIEIECNPSIKLAFKAFENQASMIYDGSLRGYGAEIVSPILCELNFDKWVNSVFAKQKALLYNRCGYHLWIQLQGWFEALQLCKYCVRWEPHFFDLVSPSRRLNGLDMSGRPIRLSKLGAVLKANTKAEFLKAVWGAEELAEFGEDLTIKCPPKESKRANDRSGHSYPGPVHRSQWLNIHGWLHRGAVEIRLHQGTINPEAIIKWKDLWLDIIQELANNPREAMLKSPLDLASVPVSCYYRARSTFYNSLINAKDPVYAITDRSIEEMLEG